MQEQRQHRRSLTPTENRKIVHCHSAEWHVRIPFWDIQIRPPQILSLTAVGSMQPLLLLFALNERLCATLFQSELFCAISKKGESSENNVEMKWERESGAEREERRKKTQSRSISYSMPCLHSFQFPIAYSILIYHSSVLRRANEIPIKQHVSQHVSVHLGLFRLPDGRRLNWRFRRE